MSTITEIIRLAVLMGCILRITTSYGQTSLKKINLDLGNYSVGFKHYVVFDSTRTYSRIYDYKNQKIPRPIPTSMWFPSQENVEGKKRLKILDYLEILKEEEEWEHLPNDQILNWFYYATTLDNQDHLKEKTTAFSGLEFATGRFPVIVYAPSYQASSIENFILCEYLASHGYIVIAGPSRGTENRWFSANSAMEIETQARDVEFLIKEATKLPAVNPKRIAIMGFSFGGLSNVIAQMRNDKISALVSLDGTERYQFGLLKKSPFFEPNKTDVPYLHMAQKDIPDEVLIEDNIDPELNSKFQLYDSITRSNTYSLKFHNLTHSYFSTLGVLFQQRDKRQDKTDPEIMESYKWVSVYTLNFLDAQLRKDESALNFIENNTLDNGIKTSLLTKKSKKAVSQNFTFQDFNELAFKQGYDNLYDLYATAKKENPTLEVPEGDLNTLGLQLAFNPNTPEQGINVLLLATEIYPNSANLFDSLGEGYLFIDNKQMAIESFKKSLKLNSQNQNAIDRLNELRE
ncbi:prolyl oligopeptidase family serine peptidase [Flavimarina sp. Hel_I_48]|uniref:prolyl oligopeptidase family serine peptidase n=1 Tax=Flavimarina sp. Hel_I_48 TaxID=1392488 RepID=UPI0004DF0CFF|nr:prolyl oligopeptidase family serine peptidase [Flavimarina sp. Hel_I_48]